MERKYAIGEHVIYVDKWGIPRDALITVWWPVGQEGEAGCDVVYISGDPKRRDPCGRQMERMSSVVHRTDQPAHGTYWCWEDELNDSQRVQLNADREAA